MTRTIGKVQSLGGYFGIGPFDDSQEVVYRRHELCVVGFNPPHEGSEYVGQEWISPTLIVATTRYEVKVIAAAMRRYFVSRASYIHWTDLNVAAALEETELRGLQEARYDNGGADGWYRFDPRGSLTIIRRCSGLVLACLRAEGVLKSFRNTNRYTRQIESTVVVDPAALDSWEAARLLQLPEASE